MQPVTILHIPNHNSTLHHATVMGDISNFLGYSDASELDEVCEVTEEVREEEDDKEDKENVEEEEGEKKRGRGPDISWRELDLFRNDDHFATSKVKQEIKKIVTKKKVYNNGQARVENYCCTYSKRAGFKSNSFRYKICFLSTCFAIQVFENNVHHPHEEDSGYSTRTNFQ